MPHRAIPMKNVPIDPKYFYLISSVKKSFTEKRRRIKKEG